jgi:hypothetical protein
VNSHPVRLEDLDRRLLSVERQNRRLKQLGAVLLMLVTSLIVMGQAPSKKTVEANEFVLLGDSGEVRAKLWTNGDDSRLALVDKNGRIRLDLEAGNFESNIRLMDSNGRNPSVTLSSNNAGISELKFLDEKGKDRLDLSFMPNVGSGVMLSNEEGQANAVLHAPSNGTAFLRLEKAFFAQNALNLIDAQGFAAQLGVADLVTPRTGETHKTSAASLVMFDKDKNVIWKAP